MSDVNSNNSSDYATITDSNSSITDQTSNATTSESSRDDKSVSTNSSTNEELSRDDYLSVFESFGLDQGLRFFNLLDFGPNGAVAEMLDPILNQKVAVKIEPFRDEVSIACWLKLDHPNVLPLIACLPVTNRPDFDDSDKEWTAYVMPMCTGTLKKEVFRDDFQLEEFAFSSVCRWLWETTEALNHLHGQGIYHLDLKTDNLLMDEQGGVLLADFTFLTNETELKPKHVGCPVPFQPPEMIFRENDEKKLQAEKVDIWLLGLMAANILSGGEIYKILPSMNENLRRGWENDLKPLIGRMKKPRQLYRFLKRTYQSHAFTFHEVDLCCSFLNAVLQENPRNRISTKKMLKHPFMLRQSRENFVRRLSTGVLKVSQTEADALSKHCWEISLGAFDYYYYGEEGGGVTSTETEEWERHRADEEDVANILEMYLLERLSRNNNYRKVA